MEQNDATQSVFHLVGHGLGSDAPVPKENGFNFFQSKIQIYLTYGFFDLLVGLD